MGEILNLSNGKTIAKDASIANTFFKRLRGLMFQNKLPPEQALVILNCNAIHSFFMRFPIDVLFVDKNNRVIKIVRNFKPWRFSPFVKGANYVVELADGTLTENLVSVGDELKIVAGSK